MRELAKAGVLVGFCGGGGTPLFSVNEMDVEVSWFSPQSEYRPTEYLQQWCSFWFDDEKRLQAAIEFQHIRLKNLEEIWTKLSKQRDIQFPISLDRKSTRLNSSHVRISYAVFCLKKKTYKYQ